MAFRNVNNDQICNSVNHFTEQKWDFSRVSANRNRGLFFRNVHIRQSVDLSQVDFYLDKMSDEVNKEAINKEFVQGFRRCYLEGGDESSRKHCKRFPVSKRAFKLISSLAIAIWFWLQFSLFNFATVGHRRLLWKIIWVSQLLHCMTDVYVTPYSSKGFKLFQPCK